LFRRQGKISLIEQGFLGASNRMFENERGTIFTGNGGGLVDQSPVFPSILRVFEY